MRYFALTMASIVLAFQSQAQAAPIEQIDCVFEQLTDAQRDQIAVGFFKEVKTGENAGASDATAEMVAKAGLPCVKKYGWTETDLGNAMIYAMFLSTLAPVIATLDSYKGLLAMVEKLYEDNAERLSKLDFENEAEVEWFASELAARKVNVGDEDILKAVTYYVVLRNTITRAAQNFVDGVPMTA